MTAFEKQRAKKRKRLKLTREQKKAIWAKPEANAGAGWKSEYEDLTTHDPVTLEIGWKDDH